MLSFSAAKTRIETNQFELLKEYDDSEMDRLQEFVNQNVYSFDYDEIAYVKLNSDCDVNRFKRSVRIVIEFIVHSFDLMKSKKSDYIFRMQSFYLIDDDSSLTQAPQASPYTGAPEPYVCTMPEPL